MYFFLNHRKKDDEISLPNIVHHLSQLHRQASKQFCRNDTNNKQIIRTCMTYSTRESPTRFNIKAQTHSRPDNLNLLRSTPTNSNSRFLLNTQLMMMMNIEKNHTKTNVGFTSV